MNILLTVSSQREVRNLKAQIEELLKALDNNAEKINELSGTKIRSVLILGFFTWVSWVAYSLESERDHYQKDMTLLRQEIEIVREQGIHFWKQHALNIKIYHCNRLCNVFTVWHFFSNSSFTREVSGNCEHERFSATYVSSFYLDDSENLSTNHTIVQTEIVELKRQVDQSNVTIAAHRDVEASNNSLLRSMVWISHARQLSYPQEFCRRWPKFKYQTLSVILNLSERKICHCSASCKTYRMSLRRWASYLMQSILRCTPEICL